MKNTLVYLKNSFKKQWHWLFAFLLIPYAYLVWIGTPSHHYDKPDCSKYHTEISAYKVIIPATEDAPKQENTKYDKKKRLEAALDCSGLEVQWVMADLTYYAFWAGIAGITLVLLTWFSAREGVKVAERIGKKQTKAYLSLSNAKFIIGDFGFPVFVYKIKNSGNSPSNDVVIRNICYKLDVSVWPYETPHFEEIRRFSDAVATEYRNTLPDIMSGEAKTFEQDHIAPDITDNRIIESAINFYKSGAPGVISAEIYCSLEYKDVFGEPFRVNYRFFGISDEKNIKCIILDHMWRVTDADVRKTNKLYANNNYQKLLEKKESKHQDSS